MAIFHFSAQVISRSAGRSSVAAAAYRAGLDLLDARTGLRHDYTKKAGCHGAEIMTPAHAPAWMKDRQMLFDEVERAEGRRDAQLCREINIALPVELTPEHNKNLARQFVKDTFTSAGMVADVAFHHLDSQNPHAHILLTLRHIEGEKFGKKNRDWNRPELLRSWRENWAEAVNLNLSEHGHEARIDARSLIDQRAEILPSEIAKSDALIRLPTIHEGGKSESRRRNLEIQQTNAEMASAVAQARAEGRLQPTPTGQWEQAAADQKEARQQVEKMEAGQRVKDCQQQTNTLAKEAREHQEQLQSMEQKARRIAKKKADQQSAWTRRQTRMVEAMKRAEEWEQKHPIRSALGWRFSRPLTRLQSTAKASRLARDKAIARHDQATALGEDLAQGMQRKSREILTLNREVEKSRQQEDEAWASLAGLKERHRWQNLTQNQQEAETRARAEAREARKHTAGEGRATPNRPQQPPQPPQRPSRPRGMGR
jgi:hypothetical protein